MRKTLTDGLRLAGGLAGVVIGPLVLVILGLGAVDLVCGQANQELPGPVPNVRVGTEPAPAPAPVPEPAPAPEPDSTPIPQDKILVDPGAVDALSACDDGGDCWDHAVEDCKKYGVGVESTTFSILSSKPCQWTCRESCVGCPQQGGAIKKEACPRKPKPIPKPKA